MGSLAHNAMEQDAIAEKMQYIPAKTMLTITTN